MLQMINKLSLPSPHAWASPVAQRVKRLPAMQEAQVRSLGQEDPLEKELATHSGSLALTIPWTEKPGRLQSMGSQTVGQDWVTSLSLSHMPVSSESQRLSGDQESSKNGPEIILRHEWWLIAPSLVSIPNIVTDMKLDTVKISVQSFEFELYLRRVEFSAESASVSSNPRRLWI